MSGASGAASGAVAGGSGPAVDPEVLVAEVRAASRARREHATAYRASDIDDVDPAIMAEQLEREADNGDRAVEAFLADPTEDRLHALRVYLNPAPLEGE